MHLRRLSSFLKQSTPNGSSLSGINNSVQKSFYSKKGGQDFYQILGISRNASEADIRKAYKTMALKYHPDRNPEGADKFKDVNNAYQVLSDPNKKQLYDMYGEEGVESSGHQYTNPEDIFSQMFGGGFPFGGGGGPFGQQRQQGPKKAKAITKEIIVSLEELYTGTTRKFQINKDVVCDTCHGNGSKVGTSPQKCGSCGGKGSKVHTRQVGPGFVQQFQQECSACNGVGETIKDSDKCATCRGSKIVKSQATITVEIDPGLSTDQGTAIMYKGQGDQRAGAPAGDLVFTITEKPHPFFTRRGDNLIIKHNLSLREALCGYNFEIAHLDGRLVRIESEPGEIVQPGQVKKIPKLGFPKHRTSNFGDLYIEFDVTFPRRNSISETDRNSLNSILPNFPEKPALSEGKKFETMKSQDVSKDEFLKISKAQKKPKKRDDFDDDEDGPQGQQAQCQSQ